MIDGWILAPDNQRELRSCQDEGKERALPLSFTTAMASARNLDKNMSRDLTLKEESWESN